jgi:hypothetical protein
VKASIHSTIKPSLEDAVFRFLALVPVSTKYGGQQLCSLGSLVAVEIPPIHIHNVYPGNMLKLYIPVLPSLISSVLALLYNGDPSHADSISHSMIL